MQSRLQQGGLREGWVEGVPELRGRSDDRVGVEWIRGFAVCHCLPHLSGCLLTQCAPSHPHSPVHLPHLLSTPPLHTFPRFAPSPEWMPACSMCSITPAITTLPSLSQSASTSSSVARSRYLSTSTGLSVSTSTAKVTYLRSEAMRGAKGEEGQAEEACSAVC